MDAATIVTIAQFLVRLAFSLWKEANQIGDPDKIPSWSVLLEENSVLDERLKDILGKHKDPIPPSLG